MCAVIMECERIKSWKIKSLRNLTELGHRVKIFCSKVFADKKFKPNFWGNKAKLHGRLLTKTPDSKVYTFECKIFNIINNPYSSKYEDCSILSNMAWVIFYFLHKKLVHRGGKERLNSRNVIKNWAKDHNFDGKFQLNVWIIDFQ